MKLLRDPNIKQHTAFQGLCGFAVWQFILWAGFAYNIGWLLILFQILIFIIFIFGVIPVMPKPQFITNRPRFEQKYLYMPISILAYGIMSNSTLFFIMYLIGSLGLSIKSEMILNQIDAAYTKRMEELEKLKSKGFKENIWTTF